MDLNVGKSKTFGASNNLAPFQQTEENFENLCEEENANLHERVSELENAAEEMNHIICDRDQ